MKIAVYAKTGSIAHRRWVRLTGTVNADGAFECEAVGASRRAHALVLFHPKGAITPTVHGYAEAFGCIEPADRPDALPADAEVASTADGTVSPAKRKNLTVGVAIGAAAKGSMARIMMRWGRQP